MKKGRISNMLQRGFVFASVAVLTASVVFNNGSMVNADGTVASKVEKCSLRSITITAGEGEEAQVDTYTGGLAPVIVNKNASWSDYFLIRTISDAGFLTDETCTVEAWFASKGENTDYHKHISGYIYLPEYTSDKVSSWTVDVQTKEGDSGAWVEWIRTNPFGEGGYVNNIYYEEQIEDSDEELGYYIESYGYVKLDEDAGYYDVKFQPRYGMVDGESPTGIYVRFAKQYDITYNPIFDS